MRYTCTCIHNIFYEHRWFARKSKHIWQEILSPVKTNFWNFSANIAERKLSIKNKFLRFIIFLLQTLPHKQTGDVLDLLELACKHRETIADDLGALASQASGGELAALISYAVAFPERFTALVDTYDVKRYIFASRSFYLQRLYLFIKIDNSMFV